LEVSQSETPPELCQFLCWLSRELTNAKIVYLRCAETKTLQ